MTTTVDRTILDESRTPATTGTIRLTAAQALLRFLGAQQTERDGIRRPLIPAVFGILGHGNAAGVGQALAEGCGGVRFLQGKNEQAMVHAAIGFAKANDRLSTLAVTTSIGPGATNLVTGAATATVNRIPVLLLPADVFARRRQGPVLQQLEHMQSFDVSVNDCLRPVSRYFDRITRPEQLIETLPHAVSALLDQGNAGAVTLALCQDVQGEVFDYPAALFAPRVHTVERQPASPAAIEAAARVIAAGAQPFLICGGGVRYSDAEDALRSFSERFGVPIGETFAGRGTARGWEMMAGGIGPMGSPAANALASDADVVIAVGTRLADTITASHSLFQHPDVRFVTLNASRFDAVKLGATPVVGDARVNLLALMDRLDALGWRADRDWSERARSNIAQWQETVTRELGRPQEELRSVDVITELGRFTSAADRVVMASSTGIGYAHALWDRFYTARCDFEYGYSCMGYEIPGALGARLAGVDEGEVYAVIGDGTYLMGNTGELVSALQEGVKISVIVLVNDGFQCIRLWEQNATGHEFGTQFRRKDQSSGNYIGDVVPVDYAANAAAFGCATYDVRTLADYRNALEASRNESGPCLIAAHVRDEGFNLSSGAWWDYGSPWIAESADTRARHDEYLENAGKQRWYVG